MITKTKNLMKSYYYSSVIFSDLFEKMHGNLYRKKWRTEKVTVKIHTGRPHKHCPVLTNTSIDELLILVPVSLLKNKSNFNST